MLGVLLCSNPSNVSSASSPKNQTGHEPPVFTPHTHRVPGIPPALPVKKQAPHSEDKRKNFSQRHFEPRVQRRTAAVTEAVVGGWWSLDGTTTTNRQTVVDNLNISKEFADSPAPLSRGALSAFLFKEVEVHRLSRSRDERATGAGDQAHSEYMKALGRALLTSSGGRPHRIHLQEEADL